MAVGYHAIIEMLTKNLGQGKVDLRLKDGKTALKMAGNNSEMKKLLKAHGAKSNWLW